MLALNRFVVASERTAEFTAQAHTALAVLAGRPGYRSGELTRAVDDPTHWCLLTRWESVGAYRRALNHYEVRVHATELLAGSLDGPTGYEVLATAAPGAAVVVGTSDLAEQTSDPAEREHHD